MDTLLTTNLSVTPAQLDELLSMIQERFDDELRTYAVVVERR